MAYIMMKNTGKLMVRFKRSPTLFYGVPGIV